MRYPFTLYKKQSKIGIMWHARIWDETLQRYAHSRTTGVLVAGKKENRREAEEAARKLCEEFFATKTVTASAVISSPQTTPPPNQEHHQKPITQTANSVANTPLIKYLENFWTAESDYAQYKRDVKGKPLTQNYIEMNHDDIRRHVTPFPLFADATVESLTKAMLKKWLIWLAGRRKTHTKKDGTIVDEGTISGRRANSVLQAVRVAIRWAFDNEDIHTDPFHKLGEVAENLKEKGVLTFEERTNLTKIIITEKNYRTVFFMIIGSFCGLRRGEIRGLKWGDFDNGLIHINHNYIDGEGLKLPKYNSVRTVPMTTEVQVALAIVRTFAKNQGADDFVFESPKRVGKPVSNNFFRDRFKIACIRIGISEKQQDERFLSCHSLRHTFVTLAELSGVPDVLIRAFTGHKNEKTQRKYSHAPQVIDFDEARKKLEAPCTANVPITKTA